MNPILILSRVSRGGHAIGPTEHTKYTDSDHTDSKSGVRIPGKSCGFLASRADSSKGNPGLFLRIRPDSDGFSPKNTPHTTFPATGNPHNLLKIRTTPQESANIAENPHGTSKIHTARRKSTQLVKNPQTLLKIRTADCWPEFLQTNNRNMVQTTGDATRTHLVKDIVDVSLISRRERDSERKRVPCRKPSSPRLTVRTTVCVEPKRTMGDAVAVERNTTKVPQHL